MFRYRKFIAISGIIGLLYLVAIIIFGLAAIPQASDIAVVLGNEVLANGQPSARLQARLDCAIALYRRHLTPLILVSGGKGKSGFDEATVMADYLIHQGIPSDAVLKDSLGVNTRATAINTATLARMRQWRRILIVTQYYHIPRTVLAFRQEELDSLSADYPRYFEVGDIVATIREGVALPVYLIKMHGKL